MAKDLFTLIEYKAYVGISSPTQDDAIKQLIPKVSQLVKSYCRRTFIDFVEEAKSEVFKGGDYLLLSEYPVLSVNSVEYSTDYGKSYSGLVEFTDYVLDPELNAIVPTGIGTFTPLVNGYRVEYLGGYESVPEDVKVASMDLLTYYIKSDMAVKSARDAGSNTVQIEYITKNKLPSHIANVLDMYIANAS